MSSIAWILLGLLIICPQNEAAKPETLCTCQQSGHGPFGSSSHSSHQSGEETSGYSGSNTEDSASNGLFDLGHFVSHAVSSAAEAADSLLSPFGHSGSSSHQHVPTDYGQSGQNKLLGQFGTRQFGPLEAGSGTSESSGSLGSEHYAPYATSSTEQAAESGETRPSHFGPEEDVLIQSGSGPFNHPEASSNQYVTNSIGTSDATSDQPESRPVGSLGSSSVQHGTRLFGPSEASSETSTSSESFVSGPYLKHATSSTAQMAEESVPRPSPNGSDEGGPSQFETAPFEHSGSNSHQQMSVTSGQLGQNQSLGQELGPYMSFNKSVATEVAQADDTEPSEFEKNGKGSVSSGSVSFGQSESSSDNRVTVPNGLSGASLDQPGREPVGASGSSSDQHGAKLLEPSSDIGSGTSTQSGSIGSENYVDYAPSSVAQTTETAEKRPSPNEADGGGPAQLGTGLFGPSRSHQNVSVTFLQSGQNKSLEPGLEQYTEYNNSVPAAVAETAETKPPQIEPDGEGSATSGSGPFGQSEPSSDQRVPVSVGLSGASSDQSGIGQVGQSGYTSIYNGTGQFGSSEASSGTSTSSGPFGSGQVLKYATSSVGQAAETAESGLSATGHLDQSKSVGQGLQQFNQYGNSVAAETKPSQPGSDGGGTVPSGSTAFGQQGPSSYQQTSGSAGQYASSSDQPELGPVKTSGSSSAQNGSRPETNSGYSTYNGSLGSGNYLKYGTSSVGQTAEESETSPSPTGPDTGGSSPFAPGPFGQTGSGPNQHVSITLGQPGQSKSFGEGMGQYNQYSNSLEAKTKASQFGPDEGLAVSSASFGKPQPSSFQQISGSLGPYGTISDQPGQGSTGPLGLNSDQPGDRLFGTSEASSGNSAQIGSLGSGHYVTHTTSSVPQTAEAADARPYSSGKDEVGSSLLGSESFGHSRNSSNQHVSVTSEHSGQIKSSEQGLGQYIPYSNSEAAGAAEATETKPAEFRPNGGGSVPSGSVPFGQLGPNTYKRIPGSFGPSDDSSNQPGRGHYLKYAPSSVSQMAEQETRPSLIGPHTGGLSPFAPGPFEQSGSIPNQQVSSFDQPGQSKSFGKGLGQYNQYSNSVAAETKPSQFGPEGEGAVSSGSVAFGQPVPSSFQKMYGSTGQYASNSDEPAHGPVGQSGSVSGQNGTTLFGPSEANSGTSTSNGSFGSGHYLKYVTPSVGQTKEYPETVPSTTGLDTGGPGSFGPESFDQSGYSSNQHISAPFGQIGQNKSYGEGLGQYNKYSNSVAAETKPPQFGSDGEVPVSLGSVSFGKPGPSSFQQIPGTFGPYGTISNQPGSSSAEPLGLSSDQSGDGLFRPSGTSLGTSTQSGSLGSGHYVTHTTPSIAQTAEAADAKPYPSGLYGGGPSLLASGPFGHSGYSSNHQVSETFGHPGQSKSSGQGLGQYIPYSNSGASAAAEAVAPKPAESGPDGGIQSGSVSFGQSAPNSYQRLPGSVGPSDDNSKQPGSVPVGRPGSSSDQYQSGVLGTSVGSSDQTGRNPVRPSGPISAHLGEGLFGTSDASSGTSLSSGLFGHGHYVTHATSPAAHTAEAPETGQSPMGPDGKGSFGHSGYSSHQHISVTFGHSGQIKSSEQGLGQYIPTAESTAVTTQIIPSPYGPYRGALAPSKLGVSGPLENSSDQSDYGPFGTASTTSNHRGSGPLRPEIEHFEPSEPVGSLPYMQYTPTSPALTADESDPESTFVKGEEGPSPTGLTPFSPLGHDSYKPVSVPFNPYGSSADHPETGSLGLSSPTLDQPVPGPYETSEQSTRPSGTSGPLGQGSLGPYTMPSEAALGSAGRPRPGLFGLSGSSPVITVPSGLFGLRPGLYVPYRNAGAASMPAKAQIEPSPYEPYRGSADLSRPSSEQPALSFIGPSTPSSYEPSTGQSTAPPESSGQLDSGLHNSHTPLEPTTVVAVSPKDKKAVLKSASRLSSLLTTARVSTAISYLLPSGGFSPSSLSKVISYLIKSIPETQPGVSGNEMLLQALLEVIASLVHILLSATIGQVGSCPSTSSSLVGKSLTHALGG